MSHLRDLQRLRNTKNSFTVKANKNTLQMNPGELKLININSARVSKPNTGELPSIRDILLLKMQGIHSGRQNTAVKGIRSSREPSNSSYGQKKGESFTNSKNKIHKRGNSVGVQLVLKPERVTQQSGLSLYNESQKFGCSTGKKQLSEQRNSTQRPKRQEKTSQMESSFAKGSFLKKPKNSHKKKDKPSIEKIPSFTDYQNKNLYNIICIVGKGGFGKVFKVQCKKTGMFFAMKQMLKIKVINKKSINSVINQRVLLAQLNHSFLINMKSSFQDRQNLYLVMDYLNGGDLRYHIGCKESFSQEQTKFFIANILIAVQYLHKNKIIHRDLKPENLVFDNRGYLRVTDLGVSRTAKDENQTDTSGTPGYMAPEVICHKNHSFTADYFAIGVMGYEFMLGRRPYNGRNRKQIREQILSKQVEVKLDELPYKWSPKAADFISKLLIRNPNKRLGSNGIDEIKNHPWLADIDWKSVEQKTLKSPFVPITIEENYQSYKEQISEDSVDQNYFESELMLRKEQVQSLFEGYEMISTKNKKNEKTQKTEKTQKAGRKEELQKNCTSVTKNTDSEHASIRGSGLQ